VPLPGNGNQDVPDAPVLKRLGHGLGLAWGHHGVLQGVAMGEVDRLTGEVARIARQSLREVQVVARNARRAGARRPGDGRLGRLVGELEETIAATERLLWQTDQRLAGNRVIPDRLVSLADPDARPIRKGKPQHPTQFGYSLLLAEDERGFIAHHQVERGNPPDAPQLLPAIERVIAVTGRAPGTVVGDRGFGTAANDQAMEALGVKHIGLQRNGTPGKARQALERTRAFRRLRNWRVGIEARISHLKRSFGLRRTRLRGLGGARTWVGLGIFAYNLQRMTVVAG
jgi:transposase, IS5 family